VAIRPFARYSMPTTTSRGPERNCAGYDAQTVGDQQTNVRPCRHFIPLRQQEHRRNKAASTCDAMISTADRSEQGGCAAFDQGLRFRLQHRPAKQETLHLAKAFGTQLLQLFLSLDPFGKRRCIEA